MTKQLIPALLLGLLLGGIGLLGYRAMSTPFFLDDVDELAYIQGVQGWADCFAGDCYGLFRPIKNLIFHTVSTCMSASARTGHGLSVVLYLLTCAVVFWWFKRWFGSPVWALWAVTLWALAPTQVNHLTWLSSANILVAICGVVGALCCYDLFRDLWRRGAKQRAALWALICIFAYWIALLAYEGAIMLPGLILLLDWVRQRPAGSKSHLLIYALLVASAVGFVCLRWSVVPPLPDNPAIVTPSRVHLSLVSAYFSTDHLWTWLAPFKRQEIMGTFVWGKTTSGLTLLGCWVLWGALVGLALRIRRGWPDVSLGTLWFLVAFAPMSNLIPFENGPFGDFYIPLPSIGLVIVLVAVLRRLTHTWQATQAGSHKRLACTGALMLMLAWRGATAAEALQWFKTWQVPEQLYAQSIRRRPYAFRARANLAPLLMQQGRYAEAEALAQECVDQAPWTALHFGLLADIQMARGNTEGARANYLKVIELTPEDKHARFSLAQICERDAEDHAAAINEYARLLQGDWNPYSARAAIHLARLYGKDGKQQQRVQVLERALAKCPPSETAQHKLASMLAQSTTR